MSESSQKPASFTWRLATDTDIPALTALMNASIEALLGQFLQGERLAASYDIMGIDTQLIADGTYYVIESDATIVGCGGWSRRTTFFGGDHSPNRDAAWLDPTTEPARIRAMYTHPDWARRGIGRLVLKLCEEAATQAGFTELVLVATMAGEPLYRACGYQVIEHFDAETSMGVPVPCIKMGKKAHTQFSSQRR